MEVQELKSSETVEFIAKLDELQGLIKTAFDRRTPHLNGEKYLTNSDLEKHLQVSKRTLQEYRDKGVIGYIRISGKVLYRQSDVLKLLEDNYRPAYRNDY